MKPIEKICLDKCTCCGEWMRIVMVSKELNGAELANKMHISKQTISNYYNQRCNVPFTTICTFVHVLDLEINPEEVWEHFYQKKD